MSSSLFILAAGALLAVPGPTNALLAVGGAVSGRDSWRLVAAAALAYAISVGAILIVASTVLASVPTRAPWAKGLCGAWLLVVAIRLWPSRRSREAVGATVSPATVFLATLLNPKAAVLALALMSPGSATSMLLVQLTTIVALVGLIGGCWALAGCAFGRVAPARWIAQGSAIVISGFGAVLAGAAVAG